MPSQRLSFLNKFSVRIMLLITVISMTLSILTATAVGLMSRSELEASIGMGLEDLSFQMADKLDRFMSERLREINFVAGRPELRDAAVSADAKRKILEDVKKAMPWHSWIAFTDDKGVVQAATGGLLEGNNISARPWFVPGKTGPYMGDVHGALLLAKHLPAPPDGNLRFVDVAAPVYAPDGTLLGVLCSHLNWEWAKEVERSLFRDTDVKKDVNTFVFSATGQPLLVPEGTLPDAWPNLKDILGRIPDGVGYELAKWNGQEYINGFAKADKRDAYQGLGWIVLARQKDETAFAPATTLFKRSLAFGVLLGLVAAIAGGLFSKRLTTPLLRIASAAEAIRGGNLETGIPAIETPEELAALSSSLRSLVTELLEKNQALSRAKATLEDKVLERTVELQQNQELLTQTQSIAKIGGWALNLDSGARSCTADISCLFEMPEEDIRDLDVFSSVFEPSDQIRFDEAMSAAGNSGEPFDLILQLAFSSNGQRWVRVIGQRADRDGERIVSGIIQDVTDQKLLEDLREDMDRIVRHDLKTPLNGIISFPQLIRDDGNLNDNQREILDLIEDSGYKMLNMINLSLDLFRMERGTYELSPEPVDALQVVRKSLADLKGLVSAKELSAQITLDGGPAAEGDVCEAEGEELLSYSMLSNLIKNALESSPRGETVSVDLSRNGDCVIAIRNKGETPVKIRDAFFEKYVTSGKQGGLGLGAYSARLMAKTMRGDVELDASEPGATTLRVKLPLPRR